MILDLGAIVTLGKMKKLIIQFMKFGVVGGIATVVDYGIMVLLTETTDLGYFLSSAISFTLSVVVNYILSMRFVFKGKDELNKFQEMAIFVALSIVGLALNQMIMWIAVEFFCVFYAVAKIFSTMLVTVYNFISRKLFLEA